MTDRAISLYRCSGCDGVTMCRVRLSAHPLPDRPGYYDHEVSEAWCGECETQIDGEHVRILRWKTPTTRIYNLSIVGGWWVVVVTPPAKTWATFLKSNGRGWRGIELEPLP